MFCLCSLLILTITLTSLTHPARPRRPLWFPGRMRNAQARHVMTSGSGDSGDVSSKNRHGKETFEMNGNYMETLWNFGKMIITCYHNYQVVVIRCDGLSLATSNALTCRDTSTCSRPAEPPVKLWQNMTSKQHPRRQPGGTFGVTFGVGRPISQANGCQLYPSILEACFKGTTWSLIDSHWYKDIQRHTKTTPCSRLPYCTQSSGVTVLDSKPRGNCCHIDDEGKLQQDGLASLRWDRHGPGMTWNPL